MVDYFRKGSYFVSVTAVMCDVIWGVSKQDTKNEKKFRDIMTHVSEKRADRYNTLWADPTANPQVLASPRFRNRTRGLRYRRTIVHCNTAVRARRKEVKELR